MSDGGVVLIAVNQRDIASTNQADVLLRLDPWVRSAPFEGHPTHSYRHLRMVHLPDGLLFEDHLDRRWFAHCGETVDEVIFPSRHVAASGKASLTLHPIGTPHLESGEIGRFGGHGGRAPPPSTRLAGWWKLLRQRAALSTEVDGFDLSLEVTHHGPHLEVPCLFIEVGSTEATWGHQGAADLLAHIIRDSLLSDEDTTLWSPVRNKGETVIVTLGGGHYAPRANLLASLEGVWLGHMLATYALPFEQAEGEVAGTWRQAIDAALDSTRRSFPNGDIVCSMDKKAFRGWQRQAIRDHLESINVPLLTSKGVVERAGKR
jgi:D-aminoacyl-tRNA deacylase